MHPPSLKETLKFKENFVILVNRDHSYKKSGNKGGLLHYKIFNGQLIAIIKSRWDELGIKLD